MVICPKLLLSYRTELPRLCSQPATYRLDVLGPFYLNFW
ncbi:FLZ-type domain-containing protein [Psidium guajava]|nr:FLZ-type domain-containing protein [Psidium guajava]